MDEQKEDVYFLDLKLRIDTINKAKKEKGLSIQQLSEMTQISPSTISRTLAMKTEPRVFTICTLEEVLGIQRNTVENPIENPIMDVVQDDPTFEKYIALQEDRIARMREYYSNLVMEKNRLIRTFVILDIGLMLFVCAMLTISILR